MKKPDAPMIDLSGSRILVVDDEIMIGLDLAQTLIDAGADVIGPCTTLADAMAGASAANLAAATLDVRLDDWTTEPVARLLAGRNVPFLFYSGQGLPETMRKRWPDCVIIEKPVLASEILAAVRSLLLSKPR